MMFKLNRKSSPIPIYQQLIEQYKQAILTQQYQPGNRIDSINEIQSRFNVSRETAKTVLKSLSDQGLIIKKRGKGSFIANLGPKKKKWVVIVPFFSVQIEQLIHHLRQKVQKIGRILEYFVDYNNWQEEIRLVGTMINERYEAVIVIPTFDESKTASFYKRLQTAGTVVTLLDHTMVGSSFPYVIQSYDLGVRRGMQYLMDRCRGSIAFVKNNTWLGRNMVQEVMEDTYINSLKSDSACSKPLVIEDVNSITQEKLKRKKITGFFCCEDTDAVRILGRLNEWGVKLNDHVAIVSYGNTDLARFFTPAITSIDPHYEEMATISAEIIQKYTHGIDVTSSQHVLQPDLIIRAT